MLLVRKQRTYSAPAEVQLRRETNLSVARQSTMKIHVNSTRGDVFSEADQCEAIILTP